MRIVRGADLLQLVKALNTEIRAARALLDARFFAVDETISRKELVFLVKRMSCPF